MVLQDGPLPVINAAKQPLYCKWPETNGLTGVKVVILLIGVITPFITIRGHWGRILLNSIGKLQLVALDLLLFNSSSSKMDTSRSATNHGKTIPTQWPMGYSYKIAIR